MTMATLKEEQEQLKSKIVESPEELKNYKELMKETVKKLKKSKVRFFSSFHVRRYLIRKKYIVLNWFLNKLYSQLKSNVMVVSLK